MSERAPSLPPYISQAAEHQRLAYSGGHELAILLDAAVTAGQLTAPPAALRQAAQQNGVTVIEPPHPLDD